MRKEIIRENITNLPFSLHDARVTKIYANDDKVILEFEEGYYYLKEGEIERTAKAYVELNDVDYDFSHVYILNFCGNEGSFTGEKLAVTSFPSILKGIEFEIIDEAYGYNQSKFSGWLFCDDGFKECNIEIYHLGDMTYVLEE